MHIVRITDAGEGHLRGNSFPTGNFTFLQSINLSVPSLFLFSVAFHVRTYLMQFISSFSRRALSQLMSSSIRPATAVASSRLALHSSHFSSPNNRNYTQTSAMAAEMTPVFAKDAAPRMSIPLFDTTTKIL